MIDTFWGVCRAEGHNVLGSMKILDLEDTLAKTGEFLPEYISLLLGYRGSTAHGTTIPENLIDDTDTFILYGLPKHYYTGVSGFLQKDASFNTNGAPLDIEGIELRKFVSLLIKGNPNVHAYLWMDSDDYLSKHPAIENLLAVRDQFLSKKIVSALRGYASSQISKMNFPTYHGYASERRRQLYMQYGYDLKTAAHLARLLLVGLHLIKEGQLMVKLKSPILDEVMAIKSGKYTFEQVKGFTTELFKEFDSLSESANLRPEVDINFADDVCSAVLTHAWATHKTF